MNDKEVGMLYFGLHSQLIKKHGVNTLITRKEFFCKLGKHYMIPKELRHFILDEMADRKLIEKVNRDNIKILPTKIDKINDYSKRFL